MAGALQCPQWRGRSRRRFISPSSSNEQFHVLNIHLPSSWSRRQSCLLDKISLRKFSWTFRFHQRPLASLFSLLKDNRLSDNWIQTKGRRRLLNSAFTSLLNDSFISSSYNIISDCLIIVIAFIFAWLLSFYAWLLPFLCDCFHFTVMILLHFILSYHLVSFCLQWSLDRDLAPVPFYVLF